MPACKHVQPFHRRHCLSHSRTSMPYSLLLPPECTVHFKIWSSVMRYLVLVHTNTQQVGHTKSHTNKHLRSLKTTVAEIKRTHNFWFGCIWTVWPPRCGGSIFIFLGNTKHEFWMNLSKLQRRKKRTAEISWVACTCVHNPIQITNLQDRDYINTWTCLSLVPQTKHLYHCHGNHLVWSSKAELKKSMEELEATFFLVNYIYISLQWCALT